MKFFEVYQNGPDRSFMVYSPANPTASSRFLVYGRGADEAPDVNAIATIDMIVDMGFGGRIPGVNRQRSSERSPTSDRRGRKINWD